MIDIRKYGNETSSMYGTEAKRYDDYACRSTISCEDYAFSAGRPARKTLGNIVPSVSSSIGISAIEIRGDYLNLRGYDLGEISKSWNTRQFKIDRYNIMNNIFHLFQRY